MTQTIDSKVVELLFKNKDFEKNAADSINTLNNLKKKLNFEDSLKSISQIGDALKNVSFKQMNDGVASIASGFTASGAIAFGVIQNIVDSVMRAGKMIANALIVEPISKGFQEYETQMNAVQTILANTQKEGTTLPIVSAALDELNAYADKTIYNFTQMTRNIGTFTAAGVKLDTSVQAIKGIANLAAVSGSNADQASTAMYQLSQALSSGTVRLMDWNSVVNAGMGGMVFQDALKETAKIHGVAIDDIMKKEGSFRDSLQTGWLTSEILTETLSKFTGDLTADQLRAMGYTEDQIAANLKLGAMASDAATKVKTFTQLFDTLKEAAQSGWSKTWQIVIGDFEEAKLFMTEMSNLFGGVIGDAANARNNFLEGWDTFGGRVELIRALRNVLDAVFIAIKPITEAMKEIFPPMTYITAWKLTKAFADFTEKLKMGADSINEVKTIFKGLFALLDIGRMAIVAVAEGIFKLVNPAIGPGANSLVDFLLKIADYIINLRDNIKDADSFRVVITKLVDFISGVSAKVKVFFDSFKDGLSVFKSGGDSSKFFDFIESLKNGLKGSFAPLAGFVDLLGKLIFGLVTGFKMFYPFLSKLGSILGAGLNSFLDSLTGSLDKFSSGEIFSLINNGLFAGFLLALKSFVNKGSLIFGDISKAISSMGGISEILGSVRGSLEAWQSNLKADTLLKLAGAIAILAASILVISMIDSVKLTSSLAAMTAMFVQLVGALTVLDKTSKLSPSSSAGMALALIGISSAMLIMSVALHKLGTMDPVQLVRGLVGISTMIGVLIVTSNALSKNTGSMISSALGMVVFAYALGILSKSVLVLGAIDNDGLARGLIGIGTLLAAVGLFLTNAQMAKGSVTGALSILVVSAALHILVGAVKKMSDIDPVKMAQGLVGIGTLLAGITLFTNNVANSGNLLVSAVGLTILSGALFVMTLAIERLSKISWEGLAKGLTAIGGALLIVTVAMTAIPPNILISALGLVVVAGALVILAEALTKMGSMSWEQVGISMAALGGSLTLLALALYAMTAALPGAAALIVAAGAILILAPALVMLGNMSLESIGIAMLGLAATFVILGVAGSVLTPVVPTLLGLAAAIFLLGIGVAAVGAGMFLFASGMAAMAAAGAGAGIALTVMITSIISLFPMIGKQFGLLIVTLLKSIAASEKAILTSVITIAEMLIDGLIVLIPKLIDGIYIIIEKVLTMLASKLPDFIKAGYDIVMAILIGLEENIGKIVETFIGILTKIVDAIGLKIPDLVDSGYNLIISFIDAMSAGVEEHLPVLMTAVNRLAISIMKGLVNGLIAGRRTVLDGIWELGTILINEFKRILGIQSPSTVFYDIAGFMISGLTTGLLTRIPEVISILFDMTSTILTDLYSKAVDFLTVGIVLIENLKNGITTNVALVLNVVSTLINSAINVLKKEYANIRQEGVSFVLGFTSGINDYMYRVISSGSSIANNVIDAIKSKYNAMREAGINFVLGFSSGISDYVFHAVSVAYNLASSVVQTVKEILQINSPSRVLYNIGKYVASGLSNGIQRNTHLVINSTENMIRQTVDEFKTMRTQILDALDTSIDLGPRITPVLDLDKVLTGKEKLDNIFKKNSLNYGTSLRSAQTIEKSISNKGSDSLDSIQNKKENSTLINFVQNNYSPEPLSRMEIYRQTKNLLIKGKGGMPS